MSSHDIRVIHEHSSDIPVVELRHILRSGSALEPEGKEGIGRIALRLLRRGAAGKGRREMDEAIDRIAAVVSAQSSTDFYGITLRVLKRYLDEATELLSEVLNRPELEEAELERIERETVAEISTSRDDDRFLASRALRLRLFEGHPYGRPSRGTAKSVEGIDRKDVLRFLEEHLSRENFIVGASGDIDEESLDRVISRTVGELPSRPAPEFDIPQPTNPEGVRVVLVDKPERVQSQILVGHVGPDSSDDLDIPLRVALTAFGGTFTSRLMREVRVKRGWSYGAYASLGRGRRKDLQSLWTFPAIKDAPECLRLVLDLYDELGREGPSAEDVEFAREFTARSFALQKDTAGARLTLRLRQELLGLSDDYYDTFPEQVRAVTDEEATAATTKHVQTRDLVVAITCTADELRDKVRAVVGEEATIETIPYDSPEL